MPSLINAGSVSIIRVAQAEKPIEVGNKSIRPPVEENVKNDTTATRNFVANVCRVSKSATLAATNEKDEINSEAMSKRRPTPLITSSRISIIKLPRNNTHESHPTHSIDSKPDEHGRKQRSASVFVNQRPRVLNAGCVSVSRVRRSSTSGPPIQNMQLFSLKKT